MDACAWRGIDGWRSGCRCKCGQADEAVPAEPLALPSQLLERRYDVVNAERTAASANAKIGVAQTAFFPTLDLSTEGGVALIKNLGGGWQSQGGQLVVPVSSVH